MAGEGIRIDAAERHGRPSETQNVGGCCGAQHIFGENGAGVIPAGETENFGKAKSLVTIESDQMGGRCGRIERQFVITVASRPCFGQFEQFAADAAPLVFGIDRELMQARHTPTSIDIALRTSFVAMQRQRADHSPLAFGNETFAESDPLPGSGDRLVDTTAGNSHAT